MLPEITIVTPSFNQARFIERTLVSVLEQGFEALEYIVVDGGSTDGTLEILERYRPRLSRLIIERDHGQADALRKGFGLARGRILGWLNSDDTLETGALCRVMSAFKRQPNIGVLYGALRLIDAEDRTLRVVPPLAFHWRTLLLENSVVPQQSAFFSRDAYLRAGGIDPQFRFCMDFDLWVRLYRAGARFEVVDDILGAFRLHGEAKTATIPEVQRTEHSQVVRRELGRDPTWGEREVERQWLRARRLAYQWAKNPGAMWAAAWRRWHE